MAKQTFLSGRVFRGTVWMVKRDISALVQIFLVWTLVSSILYSVDFYVLGPSLAASILTFDLIATPLFVAAVTTLALSDGRLEYSGAIRVGLDRYWPMLICYMIGYFCIMFGLLLLILPGLVLSVLFALAFPILVAEGGRPVAALKASFSRVRASFVPVARFIIGFFALTILIYTLQSFMGLGSIAGEPGLGLVFDTAIGVAISMLGLYLNVALYNELLYVEQPDISVFD